LTESSVNNGSKVKIEEIQCSYPKPEYPYYHVNVRLNKNSEEEYYINKLWVNGDGCRDYMVFKDKSLVYEPKVKTDGRTDIVARGDWKNDSEVSVKLELVSQDGDEKFVVAGDSKAPSYGGYWNEDWKHYFSMVVSEKDGLSRSNQPVHTTVSLYEDRVSDIEKELRIVEIDESGTPKEIPYQVSEVREIETEEDAENKEDSISFDLSFYASLEPEQGKVYLGFYGNDDAEKVSYDSKLEVTGEELEKTIENEYYKISLHSNSGVIDEVTLKRGKDKKFDHKVETNGAVHWNPGIYSPPRPWIHTSDWDPPEGYSIETGPIFTKVKLWGELPDYPEARATVTYTFYSRLPYVRVSTDLEIVEDIDVQAVRNGEIVLNHDIAREFAWKNRRGEINSVTIKDLPRFEEIPLRMDVDTPWHAFCNEDLEVGLGQMTLNLANMRKKEGFVKLEKNELFLNWGPWVYASRNLICPFLSKNPHRMVKVPESSNYYEEMAFLPFVLNNSEEESEKFKELDYWNNRLSNPLSLKVEMDTDKRVPAEFILGQRTEGAVKETEEKDIPIEEDNRFTRFRQSPILLSEDWFDKIELDKSTEK